MISSLKIKFNLFFILPCSQINCFITTLMLTITIVHVFASFGSIIHATEIEILAHSLNIYTLHI